MGILWTALSNELERLLKDEAGTPQYSDALRVDAANAALQAFATHTALRASDTITGDGSKTAWDLPANALGTDDTIEGLRIVKTGEWIEPVRFIPGDTWAPNPSGIVARTGNFFVWPHNKINLTFVMPNGETAILYYYAYWPAVFTPGAPPDPLPDPWVPPSPPTVDVAAWARQAILYYAAAYCIMPDGIKAAKIRQYNVRADSGQPEHNPVFEQAKFFFDRYLAILKMSLPQQRGIVFTPGRER
jgi:hypothetical protein